MSCTCCQAQIRMPGHLSLEPLRRETWIVKGRRANRLCRRVHVLQQARTWLGGEGYPTGATRLETHSPGSATPSNVVEAVQRKLHRSQWLTGCCWSIFAGLGSGWVAAGSGTTGGSLSAIRIFFARPCQAYSSSCACHSASGTACNSAFVGAGYPWPTARTPPSVFSVW